MQFRPIQKHVDIVSYISNIILVRNTETQFNIFRMYKNSKREGLQQAIDKYNK